MRDIPRSADQLVSLVTNTPGLLEKVKEDPVTNLKALADQITKELIPPPLVREAGIFYVIVGSLGFVAVAAIVGAIYITTTAPANTPAQIPDILTSLGSAAVGALAGILSPSPKRG